MGGVEANLLDEWTEVPRLVESGQRDEESRHTLAPMIRGVGHGQVILGRRRQAANRIGDVVYFYPGAEERAKALPEPSLPVDPTSPRGGREQVPPVGDTRPGSPKRGRGTGSAAVVAPLGKGGAAGSTSSTHGGTCVCKETAATLDAMMATFAGH
jgi:hypothetical protein